MSRENFQNSTSKVVLTCGVFDVLHAGHVRFFEWVRRVLIPRRFIVAVNTDFSLQRLKREHVHSYDDRAYLVGAIDYVGEVIPMNDTEPTSIIKKIAPDIFVKGGDYKDNVHKLPEYRAMRDIGGYVVIYPHKTHSSRGILKRLKELK